MAGPSDTSPHAPSPLAPSELRWTCDPEGFHFETTAEAEGSDLLTHQPRPVHAIQLSLGMSRLDYNVYVSGPSGLGKTRTISRLVKEVADTRPTPNDWLYVYDFQAPDRPMALCLPAGEGRAFATKLQTAVDRLGEDIGRVLHSAPLTRRRQVLVDAYDRQREALVQQVQGAATERGFELNRSMLGPFGLTLSQEEEDLLRPVDPRLREIRNKIKAEGNGDTPSGQDAPKKAKGDEAKDEDAKGDEAKEEETNPKATPEELNLLRERRQQVLDELGEVLWRLQKVSEDTNKKLEALQREAAQQAIEPVLGPLLKTYADQPDVIAHLEALKGDVLDNLGLFLRDDDGEEGDTGFPPPDQATDGLGGTLRRYYANVVIDRTGLSGAPVVQESHPTYANLLGRIEQEAHQGTLSTHFLMIKGGALHKAIGGFLILRCEDLLREPLAWEALKRAIRDGELRLEDPGEGAGAFTTRWLRPGAIPLKGTRIILTGNEETLEYLTEEDLDFAKLFKVVAQFDDTGPRHGLLKALPGFVHDLCDREGLLHLNRSAVAALAELSVRDAEDRTKLSTRQVLMSDIVRESEYWAKQRGGDVVTAQDISQAHRQRRARIALSADRIHETIARGHLLLGLEGTAVGQLNALVVSQLGPEIAFGWPTRMTAEVGVGLRGVVSIEREVRMGGPIFGKGVLIIEGFLLGRYAKKTPLSVAISVVMEQGYNPIEGDSASACELVTILSAIGKIPLKQSIAITGAVDQRGQLLPVGGVNEKIEGMYRACKERGLTGEQGVVLPRANVVQLQLDTALIKDVAAGRFHVWAADTIDDVLNLIADRPAAQVHTRVMSHLEGYARAWRKNRVI